LCNDVQREGAKPRPDLATGVFCSVPLHKIWYGIRYIAIGQDNTENHPA